MAKDRVSCSSECSTCMHNIIDNIIQQTSEYAMQDTPGTVWSMNINSS